MSQPGEMSAVLHKHGSNAEKLILQEKSQACFVASKSLEEFLAPSVRNMRLYLLLFSIELQFKRMLLGDGVPVKDLKDKFNHHLEKLYTDCLLRNLIVEDSHIENIFKKYNASYGKDLRYYVGIEDLFGSSISNESFVSLKEFYLKK